MRGIVSLSLAFTLAAAACTPIAGSMPGGARGSGNGACSSGKFWTGGGGDDNGSPLMHPGSDCIGCHAGGEGPAFVVAGTVYPTLIEANDCYGTRGATVEITDANGAKYSLPTNDAGNFYLRPIDAPGFAFPFSAKVVVGTAENVMFAAQSSGACASCHTENGANGAPGRVVSP